MIRTPWWFTLALGVICIAVSFPAERASGIFFAVVGMVFVWISYLKIRRDDEEGRR